MGVTAGLIWREAVVGEEDEDYDDDEEDPGPPSFRDSAQWAHWLTKLTEGRDRDLRTLGCGALAVYYVQEMDVDDVEWVTPDQLKAAAERLIALVRSDDARVAGIVEDYLDGADLLSYPPGQEDFIPTKATFLAELALVTQMAAWASNNGKTALAFECG